MTFDAGWLILAGFLAAAGAALWKFLPWVVKTGIREVVDAELTPEIRGVHERIDAHMNKEDLSMDQIGDDIAAVRNQLNERTGFFGELRTTMEQTQEVLAAHMAADEQQFQMSSQALVEGQKALLDRLAAIEAATTKTKKKN